MELARFEAGVSELMGRCFRTKREREAARQTAKFIACAYTASIMSDRMKEDFPSNAEIAATADEISNDPIGAIAVLEIMVEGDDVIDDGPTHAFYRKLLDDHRESIRKLDELFGEEAV